MSLPPVWPCRHTSCYVPQPFLPACYCWLLNFSVPDGGMRQRSEVPPTRGTDGLGGWGVAAGPWQGGEGAEVEGKVGQGQITEAMHA